MKVIYKKTICEQINEEIIKAQANGKRIEKILLNAEEVDQLQDEAAHLWLRGLQRFSMGIVFNGVRICQDTEDESEVEF